MFRVLSWLVSKVSLVQTASRAADDRKPVHPNNSADGHFNSAFISAASQQARERRFRGRALWKVKPYRGKPFAEEQAFKKGYGQNKSPPCRTVAQTTQTVAFAWGCSNTQSNTISKLVVANWSSSSPPCSPSMTSRDAVSAG